ncbi:MazG-like family protein [Fructilactobacillus carniphilus]|uniref:MazG-like family protein n=1 Tax=Fructilactobacillus carniphilus TaxID=2940297 RepID=A0ABY5BZ47_9LACO|nr:MazG-like family protein [Fructilactobacillus carniphilus]USS90648.1 MazG-like family protein [Fructilactobacillus carniphilus]
MDINRHQDWLINFYKQRDWYDYSPIIRMNFLNEETGELSRAIRAYEIGRDHPGEAAESDEQRLADIKEEMADVLDQVLILSDHYNLSVADLLEQSETKLKQRFNL